jgi:hypothetical protein
MTTDAEKRRRFLRLERICLALPEATSERRNTHTTFLVRAKKFAYHLDDHHGDGRVTLCFRAPPGENGDLVAADPVRFFMPPYIGPRGWAGLHLDLADVDWDEVTDFVEDSYRMAAPKRLVATVPVRR